LVHRDHAACLVWDKRSVTAAAFSIFLKPMVWFWELPPRQSRSDVPGTPKSEREVRMLVLTRKVGEEIVIGNDIHLLVVAIDGPKVRIGISAPREVVVDRQEIHERRTNSSHDRADDAVYQPIP
jgi:carbon storage regulator CsrA